MLRFHLIYLYDTYTITYCFSIIYIYLLIFVQFVLITEYNLWVPNNMNKLLGIIFVLYFSLENQSSFNI